MSLYKSEFLHILSERGFLHDCTDTEQLDQLAKTGKICGYIGFDCTAPSLHVGSLVQIMMLRWLQKTGHKPFVLIGGGTTKIGDPAGKDESRKILDSQDISHNGQELQKIFASYLTFGDGSDDAMMVDNSEWLNNLNYIEFLREIGVHFSINRMLSYDSVRLRLERQHSLSFIEFNYMLLQAFDFLELYKKFGVQLQMGGSDQWGNIVNGIDLIRRVAQQESFGITSPLLVTADNKKMGKTEKGAIWLKASMLSPYEFWQFWRNVADADAIRFLKLFTELPIDEIERLEQLKGQEINEAKKILATHVTALAHGKQAAELAEITALQTFEQQKDSDTLPTICISRDAFTKNQTLAHFLVTAQLCPSIKQAKRLVEGGGVRINGSHIDKSSMPITENNIQNGCIRVSIGKKQHVIVKLANTL